MTTNIDRAALVIAESITRDSAPAHEIVADLEHDGLLMPDPQIIRTVAELEALDPDTLLMSRKGYIADAVDNIRIPAAVIATGDQVRAAFKALEES